MRLVRFEAGGRPAEIGILTDAGVAPTAQHDMLALIAGGELPSATGAPVTEYRLLAPVPRPGKIFGSGVNYASHKQENPDAVMPTEPGFFSKFPSSVVGPGDDVRLATPESMVDWEVEFGVVIGRPGRDIRAADAFEHVFGYTVINDVSDRGVQFRPDQKDLGKGFDTFCPMGPVLVTRDELTDLPSVGLRSFVNGEVKQQAVVGDMIFDIPTLIAHASIALTLEPGDVISTGTPAGCGTFRNPPQWLQVGDVMDMEIDGIGRLTNRVVAGWNDDD